MKSALARQHLVCFIRRVLEKYGRAPIDFGNAFDAISRTSMTAFWFQGDDSKCLGFYRAKYTGQDSYDVAAELFDTPRPKSKLRPLEGCAFESVTKDHIVAMAIPQPVHGNN